MSRAETALVTVGMLSWYLLAYVTARPLANAPVVDSWIYTHAVGVFATSGRLRFVGFAQALPVAQVIYGAAWSGLFGQSQVSFDLSVAALGALGGILFYALLRRCGAGSVEAAIATGLLVANPCYLFMSFSFMTEIPFLVLLIASYLAFARAEGAGENLWLWLSAALTVGAFLVRPFAAAAIVGFGGALLAYDLRPSRLDREWLTRAASKLSPFAAALALCALAWIWLTVLNPKPWRLKLSEQQIKYVLDVPPATYLRAGVLGPLLYLGLVLSPLALIRLPGGRWRRGVMLAAAIFAVTWMLVRLEPQPPATPELSCFGGWSNALLLRGLPNRFWWEGGSQWIAAALGSLGAAAMVLTAPTVLKNLSRAGAAVMPSAACYWAGSIPLWLFSDRYYLVLVPAGCLLLALAPSPSGRGSTMVAVAMTAVMGWVSLAGLYDYHRGLSAVVAARDTLERSGVPRAAIDAGYSLNGAELYRYLDESEDTYEEERGIPMVTSAALHEYTIAAAPVAGTEILRRLRWPGPFGFGWRELYVLRKIRALPGNSAPPARPSVKQF